MPRIPDDVINQAGGDWGGYGELTGPEFLALLQQDAVHVYFGNKSLLINVVTKNGPDGTYTLTDTSAQLAWTIDQIAQATGCPIRFVSQSWPVVASVFNDYSPKELVAVIGTIVCETGVFYPVREAFYIYDPNDPINAEVLFKQNPTPAYNWYNDTTRHAAYSGGPDYHGRGFDQLTHDYNYKKVGDAISVDLLHNPDLLLTDMDIAVKALRVDLEARNIRALAGDWAAVRRAVYGGNDPNGAARIGRIATALGI